MQSFSMLGLIFPSAFPKMEGMGSFSLFLRKWMPLVLILVLGITEIGCTNYLSDDQPLLTKPPARRSIPLISLQIESPDGDQKKKKITEEIQSVLEESGLFQTIVTEGIRAPVHLHIYTAGVDSFEDTWLFFASSIFSTLTLGIVPAVERHRRVMTVETFINSSLKQKKEYTQKSVTLYSLIFMFQWEDGILERETILQKRDRNLILNALNDLPEY